MCELPKERKEMSNNETTSGGISFTGILFIVFLILKLTHVINWSWWWVTAPLWGGLVLLLAVLIIVVVVAGIATTVEELGKKARK